MNNEMIKEIANQALIFANQNMDLDSDITDSQVFAQRYVEIAMNKHAELIIKECGKYLDSPEFIGRSDLDWSIILNEHFGIK